MFQEDGFCYRHGAPNGALPPSRHCIPPKTAKKPEARLCSIDTTCASGDFRSCLGGFGLPVAPQPGASPSSPGTFPVSEPASVAPFPLLYHILYSFQSLARWLTNPFCIPCASLVHIGNMAKRSIGGGLKGYWRGGDDLAGFLVPVLPAVPGLAGHDEDLLAGAGFAIAGLVEGRDLAPAADWGWEQSQVGDVPALVAARGARFLADPMMSVASSPETATYSRTPSAPFSMIKRPAGLGSNTTGAGGSRWLAGPRSRGRC